MQSRTQTTFQEQALILMTDARFTTTGYAIMIEDNPNQKLQYRRKTYALIAFGSKTFNPTQHKLAIYAKEFPGNLRIVTSPVGKGFPGVVFTDNRSVTRFNQTKILPTPFWNTCDYVLLYNFVLAHVAGAMNTAADFFPEQR